MRLIDADEIRIKPDFILYDVCGTPVIRCEDLARIINDMPAIEPQKWIPFRKRELTEEEQEMYPEWSYWLDCELPEDGDEILISSPTWGVYKDTFNNDGSAGCYLEGDEEIDDGMAWRPLPEPWKGEEE